ncbi:MAG TPA: exosome complex exonuclease Rrp41, partial [Methanomassiliicoccales archaeon]|nr:exosome complex exonuclease Rrp41 [Methanomassiliicoccales archaeon]
MGGNSNIKLIDDNGIRIDGRKVDELRPIKIEAGVLKNADGSAYVEMGKNKVLAAVYGPRECHPRHMQNPAKAIVQCKYNMISFSVDDRKRPGPDRRSVEISKIISEALENVVFTENYPRTSVDVFIEVIQANAGTRCAGLTAASVALADAGIPMKDLIPAVAVGKVNDQIVLDLNKEEDNYGQADLPLAMIPRTGEIVLMQMDGHMTYEEFQYALELGTKACAEIYDIQKDAL